MGIQKEQEEPDTQSEECVDDVVNRRQCNVVISNNLQNAMGNKTETTEMICGKH